MGRQQKQWQASFSWAPKSLQMVTAGMILKDACSLEAKLWQTYSILKSRDIADKGLSSQNYGFSSSHVWMWELDHKWSWAPKNWCFEVWYWRRLLRCWRASWTAKRWNQSILEKTSSEYSLEGLKLKLRLRYFDHLIWSPDSLERTLFLGKIEGRRSGWQGMRWLDGITKSMASFGSWWRTEMPGVLQSMGSQRVGHDWVTEQN